MPKLATWIPLLLLATPACTSSASLVELGFAEEPSVDFGINGADVYGTGQNDLWAVTPGRTSNGAPDPTTNHFQYHAASGTTSIPFPPAILAIPGQATAWAAGKPGEIWMIALAGPADQTRAVLVSMTADGTATDHSAGFPIVAQASGPGLISDHGVVVAASGNSLFRFDSGTVTPLPDPPAGYFIRLIAMRGQLIFANGSSSSAPDALLQFDGAAWSVVPVSPIGIEFSFFGPQDGWAFNKNSGTTPDHMFDLYRYDGTWSTQRISAGTPQPIGVLATGPNTYALLGMPDEGRSGVISYRTGTVSALAATDQVLSTWGRLSLSRELDDGIFLMTSLRIPNSSGGVSLHVFEGDRTSLH